jgi:porin
VVADATLSDKRTASIPSYFLGALVVQGPFAPRPHDFIALGYVRDMVNNNAISREESLLAAQGEVIPGFALGENIVEVGYGLQATPWMLIHPNLQFIGNPGAFSFKHVPNAWVFGAQLKLTF